MKLISLLSAVPAVTAFVVPQQEVFADLVQQDQSAFDRAKHDAVEWYDSVKSDLDELFENVGDFTKKKADSALDQALAFSHSVSTCMTDEMFNAEEWTRETLDHMEEIEEEMDIFDERIAFSGPGSEEEEPPHHRRPGPPPPDHDHPEHPPHRGPPHRRPGRGRRPHHPHRTNLTVYQIIAESKYTTKLAELINDMPDLVKELNNTEANFTIFAPVDSAFAKIPKDAPKPSKEDLKKILAYHVTPDFYPAGRVLRSHTIPTLFNSKALAKDGAPQRLAVKITLRGLTLNYISRVIAIDIFGTNGVVHGLDSIIPPPPPALTIVDLLPSEFSTLELGLTKTGLTEELAQPHEGGTLFAPSNFAFAKLGPRLNAFLFSKYGQKYLKALLKYHVVPKHVIYSDAIYRSHEDKDEDEETADRPHNPLTHLSLPTLLEDQKLYVDIARWRAFASIKVNGFVRVVVQDGIAKDGVIQVISDVLIPPKKGEDASMGHHHIGKELTVEDLKERLEPYIE